ncbi:MAG: hypothetical protein RLZZ292_2634 [Bacteroidota bacterium]|jgi:cell division protein FtsZ
MIFDLPRSEQNIIKVIGVGGGGSNAVTHMFKQGIVGVDFAICNTDNQAMDLSPVPIKMQLGPKLTDGRGAGSTPQVGKQACIESIEEVRDYLANDTKMLFVTAGMGGGTGTGAAPIIAKLAREMGVLTVGIVTLPFTFEGRKRNTQGMEGLDELRKSVDTLIVISNDKLREIYGNLSVKEAFAHADNILTTAAKGIAEIITVPGYVNVDFADVDTVMRNSGVAIMGIASAEGDDRARRAVDEALNSPLLEESNIKGAQNILVNIASGTKEVTMDEIFQITEFVQDEAGYGTNLIWGNSYDEKLGDKIAVTIIATGFENGKTNVYQQAQNGQTAVRPNAGRTVIDLDEDDRRTSFQPSPPPRNTTSLYEVGLNGLNKNAVDLDARPTAAVRTSNFERYQTNHYSTQDPYVVQNTAQNIERERQLEEERRRRLAEQQRRDRLRNTYSAKNTSPQNIQDLENVPAYMRRGVSLDDTPHSSAPSNLSRWTISDDEEPQIRANNPYLHDNVD